MIFSSNLWTSCSGDPFMHFLEKHELLHRTVILIHTNKIALGITSASFSFPVALSLWHTHAIWTPPSVYSPVPNPPAARGTRKASSSLLSRTAAINIGTHVKWLVWRFLLFLYPKVGLLGQKDCAYLIEITTSRLLPRMAVLSSLSARASSVPAPCPSSPTLVITWLSTFASNRYKITSHFYLYFSD